MSRIESTSPPDIDDRISDLPEPILGRILSCLRTKKAMATSILSKRWKFLWTTTGNLDFYHERGADVEQFVQFVNYVLLFHKPAAYFHKLSLIWLTGHIPFYVNTWISVAVARDVHELKFYVGRYKIPQNVQSYLLSNEKLKSLELRCKICIPPEIVVSLPRLESLDLGIVSFQNEEAFCRLLEGCPVLKRLKICIQISATFKCIIASTSLKHLSLSGSDASPRLLRVELDAPSLKYIYLYRTNSIVLQQRLNFLCEASINHASFGQDTRDPNYSNSTVEAVHALSCAQTLDFSREVMRALSCSTIKMKTGFNRLTSLTVYISQNYWSAIQNLIDLSDNLELLTIYTGPNDNDNVDGQFNNSNWTKPNVVPKCLSNSLTKVSFNNCDGHLDELAMVEYIIKHGSVLETIDICFHEAFRGLKRKYKLVQLISTFPRKSTTCEVNFDDDADADDDDDADADAGEVE